MDIFIRKFVLTYTWIFFTTLYFIKSVAIFLWLFLFYAAHFDGACMKKECKRFFKWIVGYPGDAIEILAESYEGLSL